MENNYILDDDDSNMDLLTPELIEVDKKEDNNLVNKSYPVIEEKKK